MKTLILLFVVVGLIFAPSASESETKNGYLVVHLSHQVEGDKVIRASVRLTADWMVTSHKLDNATVNNDNGSVGHFSLANNGTNVTEMAMMWGLSMAGDDCETITKIEEWDYGFGATYATVTASCKNSEVVAAFRTAADYEGVVFTGLGIFPKGETAQADAFLRALGKLSIQKEDAGLDDAFFKGVRKRILPVR